jgi:type II secretory pathway pseudopilin PulG
MFMNELQPLAVKPKQGGYTIIELGIALTIIAVLIVAGLAGVTTVLNSSKANAQIEDSGIVLAKLQSALTSSNVSGITTATGVGSSFFPPSRVLNNVVTSKFAGNEFIASNAAALTVATHGVDVAISVGAIYTITAVPRAVCADIASSLANLSNSAWIHTEVKAEATAGASAGLTAATSQIKAPGGTVNAVAVGRQCNLADTVNLAFFMRP